MIDSNLLLNDVEFAKAMLEKKELTNADIVFTLRNLLKMKYYPVAVKFFFSDKELEDFKKNINYKIGMHPLTVCHLIAGARQKGEILLGTKEKLGCGNAKYVFGWKEFDKREVKGHLKYTKNEKQAEKFVKTKKRLKSGLLAYAAAPLHKATYKPDVIHGVCDVLQSYHIANDWCAAFDVHPFEMRTTINSSVCHGIVACHVTGEPNITTMCSGSYTAGKTEQGEINWIMPGSHIEPLVKWTLERTARDGGASFPRTGETYPGFNVCKLCPYLTFTTPKEEKK